MKKILFSLIFIVSQTCFASGWTGSGKITELNHQQLGGAGSNQIFLKVSVDQNPSSPENCIVRDGFFFEVTDDRTERLFTILLSSLMANREIKLFVTGECHAWGYARLDGVILN